MPVSALQGEFAQWLLLTDRQREDAGLPSSQAGFAELKGVTDRTLRRWRKHEAFEEYLGALRAELSGAPPPASLGARRKSTHVLKVEKPASMAVLLPDPSEGPAWDDRLSPDEQQYATVKAEIARQASGGDARATEIYMKHWGDEHLRRERAEHDRLAGMSDLQLVREVVQLLGTETVASVLLDM